MLEITAHREKLIEKGLSNQPLLVVIGDELELERTVINFNNTIYDVENFIKAVSVIFKIFFNFNVRYPEPAKKT